MAEKIKKIYIDGMTCAHCESAVEKGLLNISGVIEVKASYNSGTALVAYENGAVSLEQIEQAIIGAGYTVRDENANAAKKKSTVVLNVTSVLMVLVGLFFLLNQLGIFGIFSFFSIDTAGTDGASLIMLFIIGLLTSVHCIAMCGGINISQCIHKTDGEPCGASCGAKNSEADGDETDTQAGSPCKQAEAKECSCGKPAKKKFDIKILRSSFLYNFGRLISYTLVGLIVGAIGMALTFSDLGRGIVSVATGVLLIIMGLNMLGCLPFLRYIMPRMPKFIAKKINKQKSKSYSPFIVGILNGFMPCGPLQTMQIYALSTGSPFLGALSMFLFGLGTIPLMFILGAVSSVLTKKFMKKAIAVSSVLVIAMGLYMFSGGASVAGMPLPGRTSAVEIIMLVVSFILIAAGLLIYNKGAIISKILGTKKGD